MEVQNKRQYTSSLIRQNLCLTILTGVLNQLDKEQGISKNNTPYTPKQVNPKILKDGQTFHLKHNIINPRTRFFDQILLYPDPENCSTT